mgnify:CR=1 FL=1
MGEGFGAMAIIEGRYLRLHAFDDSAAHLRLPQPAPAIDATDGTGVGWQV